MRSLRFKKINAFASEYSDGNPAAAIYLDSLEDLTDAEMHQIAKELKGFVSEVGYVSPGVDTDYRLRYFSSEREVAFCGHATIAIMNDIVANNQELQNKVILTIETKTDRLLVENRFKSEKSVYISAPPARFSPKIVGITEINLALNCLVTEIDQSLPIEIVNGGLETLIVPIVTLDSILSLTPDIQTLDKFCKENGVDIVILYSTETVSHETKFRTRVFAPTFGYLEDPATGSGNAALGYYLLKHAKWNGEMIKIEQNGFRDYPNYVQIFSKGTDIKNCQVWFGGGAILKVDGEYILQ